MRFKTKLSVFGLVASLAIWLLPGTSLAGAGQIYLSPSSVSVQKSNNITIALRINPGTSVNAVQATVGYNPSDLQFVSTSLGVFSTCAQNSGGGGSVTLGCAILGSSTSSDSLVASITFTALAGSGSDSLTIGGANAANNGTYTNPSTAGAAVSFTTPAAGSGGSGSTPSKSTSSKSTTTTKLTTTTTAVPTTAAAPVIKPTLTTKSSYIQYSQASFGIASSIPVEVAVQYGTSASQLDSTTAFSALGTNNTVSLNQNQLTPGTTYYYMIVAKDANGNVTDSVVKSITTKGFTVQVTVLDGSDHPIVGQKVTLHSTPMTAKTDSNGVVVFNNVAPGAHHVEYSVNSKTYSGTVYVDNTVITKSGTQTAAPQRVAVVYGVYQLAKTSLQPLILLLAVFAALFIGGTAFLFHKNPLSGRVKAHAAASKSYVSSKLVLTPNKQVEPVQAEASTTKPKPASDPKENDDPQAKGGS